VLPDSDCVAGLDRPYRSSINPFLEHRDLFRSQRRHTERHPDGAAHGSGCTHSSALAAHLALGFTPEDAARAARRLASEAVRDGHRDIGRGPGPVNVLGVGVQDRTPDRLARRA